MPATRLFRFQQSGKHIFDFTTKLIDLHSELVQGWTLLCTWKGFFGGLQQFLQQLGNGRCHDLGLGIDAVHVTGRDPGRASAGAGRAPGGAGGFGIRVLMWMKVSLFQGPQNNDTHLLRFSVFGDLQN